MSRPLKVLIIGDGDAGKTSLRSRYLTNQFKSAYRTTIGADFISKTVEVSVPVPRESRRRRRLSTTSSSNACTEVEDDDHHRDQTQASSSSQPINGKGKSNQQTRPPLQQSDSLGLAAAAAAKRKEVVRVTLSIWDTAGQERFRSLGTAFYRGADAVIIAFDITKKGALTRTLSWYRDFCAMGDLNDESDFGLTSKQRRKAKQQRERFCWVAVGCKGDLLNDLRQGKRSKDEIDWKGTSWQVARNWFDELQPRYLPSTQSESNAFDQFDSPAEVARQTQPYVIDDEVPANPEDVLSRPSPKKFSADIYMNDKTDSAAETRHPNAGTPPGSAQAPGKNAKLIEQASPLKGGGNLKKVHPIQLWQEGLPISKSDEANGTSADSTLRTGTYERSRYDSATSQSGNSIYYSVRGSTMMSQSPATLSSSSTPTVNGHGTNGAPRINRSNYDAHVRNGSLSSHQSFGPESFRTRKKSNLSEVIANDANEKDEVSRSQSDERSKSPLVSANSEQSSGAGTERGFSKQEEAPVREINGNSIDAISTVPSGDPIPFPTDNDEDKEEKMDELRARRRKRLSKLSQKRQSIASLSAIEADESAVIAERTKELRLEEEKEIHEIEDEERAHTKRLLHVPNEDVDDKRMTLFSARPSSTSSTIRPADGEILVDGDANGNGQHLHQSTQAKSRQHSGSNEADSHAASNDENPDSDSESDLYEDHLEQGFRLFYTSAKTGSSIDDVFQHIAYRVALKWTYEEWEEAQRRQAWGYGPEGEVRTAPPTNEEIERERLKRAIKISQGKGTGGCCS